MKAVKTIFAILVLATVFVACESENVNDEIGLDANEILATEDAGGEILPPTDEE